MKSLISLFTLLVFFSSTAFGAVPFKVDGLRSNGNVEINGSASIGTSAAPDSKAVLDLVSTTKGFLTPRMTTAQRDAISSPTTGLLIYNTDTNTLNQYNGTAWGVVAGSGGGGRNYIEENPDAETDTTGWVTYADAAGSIPVDGTGGSASITWTRTTSNALAGAGSFLLTKDAANRQGNGVSFDFTIEREDRGKMLQIDYTYEIASGTFATGDLSWHIYDVSNSRYIQPSAYQVENVGVSSHAQPLQFQTSIDSTSYRLILHVASTSASAYTAKFDSVKVGPQNQANGPPVTDWVSFTPTGSWAGTTAYSGRVRQVGDLKEFQVRVIPGSAPTGSALTVTISSVCTIDASKLASGTAEAMLPNADGSMLDNGSYFGLIMPLYSSTTAVQLRSSTSTTNTTLGQISPAAPITWTTGDTIDASFSVPCVGISSNVVVSSSANTRPVTARYTTGTAGSYGTGGAVLDFPLKVDDSHGAVTTGASWKYTAKVPGKYRVSIGLSPSGTNGLYAELYKNGVTYARLAQYRSGANPPQITGTTKIDLVAGDYFNIVLFSETATTSLATAAHLNYIDIEKIDGPSQIAATDLIEARYTSTSGNTLTTTPTIQDFATKTYDTHNAVTTGASWRFTAPAAGYYEISVASTTAATTTVLGVIFELFKNGVYYSQIARNDKDSTTSSRVIVQGTDSIYLLAGEYVDIRNYVGTGTLAISTTAGQNYITVRRAGGLH